MKTWIVFTVVVLLGIGALAQSNKTFNANGVSFDYPIKRF